MKILAIIGSPKGKGNSYALTRKVEEKMRSLGDVEFEYLFLKDVDLQPCRGCYVCLGKGEGRCPLKDDRPMIEEKMRAADGVIFVSPTYVINVSGLMKNFIDRFAYVCHRPRFFKRSMVISTTGGVGQQVTALILAVTAMTWGYSVAYRLGAIYPPDLDRYPADVREKLDMKADAMAAKAARRFYGAIKSGMPAPGIIGLAQFRLQKNAFFSAGEGNVDHEYWKNKGWFDRGCHYYYVANVNPIKKLASVAVEKLMTISVPKYVKTCGERHGHNE